MSERLLNADTRLPPEAILDIYKAVVTTPIGVDEIDLTIIFDMALREAHMAEKRDANIAILKARTEEMYKALDKLDRVRRVYGQYQRWANEYDEKLEGPEGWKEEGLDETEMQAELYGAVCANLKLALSDLVPMTAKEVSALKEYDVVWWTGPDGGVCSRFIRVKNVEVSGGHVKLHGFPDEYLECLVEELRKVK